MLSMRILIPLVLLMAVIVIMFWKQREHALFLARTEPVLILVPLALESITGADMYRKMRFALEEAGGKAGERPVELLTVDLSYLDDAGKLEDDERISSLIRTLSDKRVVGVLGPITTDASILSTPLMNAMGLAQISYTTTYPGFTVSDFSGNPSHADLFPTGTQTFFTLVPHTIDMAHAVSRQILQNNTPAMFTVHDNTTFSKTATDFLVRTFEEEGGTVVATGTVPTSAGEDTTALVEKIIASKTTLIFITSYPHEGYYAFLNTLHERGYSGHIMGYNIQRSHVVENTTLRDKVLSVNYTPSLMWMNTPVAQDFIARYKTRYPENPEDLKSIFTSYDAMKIMLAAIQDSDGTRQGVLDTLRALKTSSTLYGYIAFDENGYRTRNALEISELIDGTFTFKAYIEP